MKIDPRYVVRLLAAPDEDAANALAQLSSFWSARAQMSEAGELTGLSPAEMAAHLALWYFGQVGNGGHAQYFMNPVGAFAHETLAALEQLGLKGAARILRDAFGVFSERQVPKAGTDRYAAIEALGPDQLNVLDQCDLILSAMPHVDIDILRYLRQHRDQVLTPEQS